MTVSDILWLIFEICINLFQGFAITWFLDRILVKKETAPRWAGIICALSFALCCTTYLFFPMPANDSWISIVPFLYVLFCFKNSFGQKLLWVICGMLCLIGSSYLMIWIMGTFFSVDIALLLSNSFARIIFVVTANLIIFILFLLIPKAVKNQFSDPLPLALFAVIMVLLLFVADAMLAIFYYETINIDFWSLFSCALVLVITILTIILYFIMSNYARAAAEKKLLEARIAQETQRMEDLDQVSNSLHALRHDLRDQLNIAANLMMKGNAIESKQYLTEIDSRILQIFSTGCHPLDSALYLKQQEMQHHGIRFQTLITPLKALPIPAYELCTIVINLLENAIEAVDRFPDKPDNYTIKLSIHPRGKTLCIDCSNPVWEPSLTTKDGIYISSKSESGHGKGIPAIKNILDRMNAQRSFRVEDGLFKVLIILPYWGEIDVNLPHEEAVKQHNAFLKEYAKTQTWWARLKREIDRRRSWRNI